MHSITHSLIRPLIRLVALGTTVVGLVLVAAAQATAKHPAPGPEGPFDFSSVPITTTEAQPIPAETSTLPWGLPWELVVAAVVVAAALGAALVYLTQRHLAHRHGAAVSGA